MDQLRKLLASLTPRQRISLAVAAVVVIAALFWLAGWRREGDFRPLYTGLAAEDAGAVVAKLRERGVEYRIAENGSSVLAPSAQIAELRLQMAAAGLPKTGRAGFELFDKTNFGLTEFAEHINYQRAVEGELERSIMALSEVEQARVHLTLPKDSIFAEGRQPAKASVMIKLRPARQLAGANVLAVTHLVSSAVEGLTPEAVSVLDMNGNLLSRRRAPSTDADAPADAALDYQRQIEKDLLVKVSSTLEPLLGAEKFRAGVSVECDFSSGEQSEETYDPNRAVVTSSQKTEDVAAGAASTAGVPGTASNLPNAPPRAPGGSGLGTSRRTESVAYQPSRVVRRMRLPQGGIRKISIAVLIDQDVRWEGAGPQAKRFLDAPPPEQLKRIQDVVAAATGLNSERGDRLIVESLPFESTLHREPPRAAPAVQPPPRQTGLPVPILVGAGIGAATLALLGAGALILSRRRKRAGVALRPPGLPPAADPEQANRQLEAHLAAQEQLRRRSDADALNALKSAPAQTKKSELLAKHLIEAAKKDPLAAAQVLRSWIYDAER